VNNAAFPPDTKPVNELDEDYLERLLSVNYKGVAYGMKWASKQMIEQGKVRSFYELKVDS
jgi:NAD(P)-dependent dehydrogenase (short-subunit alcohol dehydrogenase family)